MRIAILFTLIGTLLFSCQPEKKTQQPEGPYNLPAEDFFLARNYPDASIDVKAYTKALKEARESISFRQVFKGFEEDWIVRGPANLGARINTVAVHPNDEDIIYVGFSRGGVWRTTDGGINWEPIFDDQLFLAIGDIVICP
jgi:hypothetical protein